MVTWDDIMAAQGSKSKPEPKPHPTSSPLPPQAQNSTPTEEIDLAVEYQSYSDDEDDAEKGNKTRYFSSVSESGEDWELIDAGYVEDLEDDWDLLGEMRGFGDLMEEEKEGAEGEGVGKGLERGTRCMWMRMRAVRKGREDRGTEGGRGCGKDEKEREDEGNDGDEGDWEMDFCKVVGVRGDGGDGEFLRPAEEKVKREGEGEKKESVRYGVSVVEGGAGGIYAWQAERGGREKVRNFCLGCRREVCTCPETETEGGCGKCL